MDDLTDVATYSFDQISDTLDLQSLNQTVKEF